MADIKLFRIASKTAQELPAQRSDLEKGLQTLIERHMEALLGVRFVKTEHPTGAKHAGRIDSLGIDENGCPVIVEYKRDSKENVMNQGLYYLDWLMDHKAEFEALVIAKLGKAVKVDWSAPRLICVASDFTKYDEHAVAQIDRNIDLVRYRQYAPDLLLLELVNAEQAAASHAPARRPRSGNTVRPVAEYYERASEELRGLYDTLEDYLLSLGDDVQKRELALYNAFRRIKNFACVEMHPQKETIIVFLKIDPKGMKLKEGFTRDVSRIGHYGTGDLEVTLRSEADLERAKPLIERSYEES